MVIYKRVSDLQSFLTPYKEANKKIGFVPTMGALHEGHLSLLKAAKQECDIVVASVFVNPTQFNNPSDLEKYPRMPQKDADLLEQNGCDVMFLPEVEDIYPAQYQTLHLDLSPVDEVMEGKYRPGHFDGVVNVVSRLFDIVQPNKAYFGRKDFQQVAVIRAMTKKLNLGVEIIACDTVREEGGLAMSSRNLRLNEAQKKEALVIYQSLIQAKKMAQENSPTTTLAYLIDALGQSTLELEYAEVVNPETLLPLTDEWIDGATACVVAYCGDVRLIDNMELI
ncbi:pantothenate synthetase [Lishizhenia tianjinensis]|uniref:Pantothenate synthetase n=1 Tax=Lishizhenia tianjinensis TaxID=477690 RepID=A0A1I7B2Z7_9FLAO|nr:pantoate--beta-alanine ligase [Lishizhenia tianjinensis]SFT81583.1 pantothenate synthetase [Lishizhenia tianjinensis]